MLNNPFLDVTRHDRWEVGLPELNMDQLRAPKVLSWIKVEGKPGDVIRITRKSDTAGESIYYRVVIKG